MHRRGAEQAIAADRCADAQLLQDGDHLLGGHVDAHEGLHIADGGLDQLLGLGVGIDIDHAVHDLAGAQLLHELHGPIHGQANQLFVDPMFETALRLGAQAQRPAGLADGGAVEASGLKEDQLGVFGDFRPLAAHDARQARGAALIGDDQHLRA